MKPAAGESAKTFLRNPTVWLITGILLVLLALWNFDGWHPFYVEYSKPFHIAHRVHDSAFHTPLFVPSTLFDETQQPFLEHTAELAQDLTTPESLSFIIGAVLIVAWKHRRKPATD